MRWRNRIDASGGKPEFPTGIMGSSPFLTKVLNVFRCSPENRTSFGVRWLINAVPREEKTRFPSRILQSLRIGSEIAGDLASIEIRNNGAYGNKVYLPAFTEKRNRDWHHLVVAEWLGACFGSMMTGVRIAPIRLIRKHTARLTGLRILSRKQKFEVPVQIRPV